MKKALGLGIREAPRKFSQIKHRAAQLAVDCANHYEDGVQIACDTDRWSAPQAYTPSMAAAAAPLPLADSSAPDPVPAGPAKPPDSFGIRTGIA
jgi:hypothetical protein